MEIKGDNLIWSWYPQHWRYKFFLGKLYYKLDILTCLYPFSFSMSFPGFVKFSFFLLCILSSSCLCHPSFMCPFSVPCLDYIISLLWLKNRTKKREKHVIITIQNSTSSKKCHFYYKIQIKQYWDKKVVIEITANNILLWYWYQK